MLNKRSLVEYSDSDSDSNTSSGDNNPGAKPQKILKIGGGKPKAKINYSSLPIADPLKTIKSYLEDEKKYSEL